MSEINFQDWVGRQQTITDWIGASHAQRIANTLDQSLLVDGDALPWLWHWAYFVEPVPLAGLGIDGHPQRGGFLPPIEYPNRMWAGSRLRFLTPMKVGQAASRLSTIRAVEHKQGRTGPLVFVTVHHAYQQEGVVCIEEEQDIVYRELTPPKLVGELPAPEAQWSDTVTPTPMMLFRYSAITFNGHRIHYDIPYVTEVEGYPNLVVHGPLIATRVLQAFEVANPDKQVTSFQFRGVRPLIAPTPFHVEGALVADTEANGTNQAEATDGASVTGETRAAGVSSSERRTGEARLWAQQDGMLAQQAKVTWRQR